MNNDSDTHQGNPLAEILQEMRRSEERMEARLKKMEEDVQRSQEEALQKASKRARREKSYVFKKRGHQAQSEFNDRVADCLERASEEMSRRPADESGLAKAKEALDEGLRMIANRQKLIKIADRSEYGWGVVAEYEADDLASGSEDEKRLEKAEKAAERKAFKKRKIAAGASSRSGGARPAKTAMGNLQQLPMGRFSAGGPSQQPTQSMRIQARPVQAVGPCFMCGELGHLKRACTKWATAPGRWYPGDADTEGTSKVSLRGCVECVDKSLVGVKWGVESTERESAGFDAKGDIFVRSCDGNVVNPENATDAEIIKSEGNSTVEVRKCVAGTESIGDTTVDGNDVNESEDIASTYAMIKWVHCQSANDSSSDIYCGGDSHEKVPNSEEELNSYETQEPVNSVGVSSAFSMGTVPKEHVGEYEESLGIVSVKGRLAEHVTFWERVVKAPAYILDIIKHGYVIPFLRVPTAFCQPNQSSALNNHDFVDEALDDLLKDGRVREVEQQPHICSPLSVVVSSSGKKRLVVNLRHVNKFLCKQKFRYEDLKTALLLFDTGDLMFTFDLKSGYHHIDICPSQWTYLGFAWNKGGHKCFFVFTVLPFGLATACYIFTKVLRPLVKLWRGKGVKIVVYLDDGIGAGKGHIGAMEASAYVRNTLRKSGFVDHPEKCKWNPSATVRWLGFELDLETGTVSVPREKIIALKAKLAALVGCNGVCVRHLASVAGTVISMGAAIGPVSRFMTRSMYSLIESRKSWYDHVELTKEVKEEIDFWSDSLQNYNAQPIWHSPSAVRIVYSDASDTGYGGYTVEHGPMVAHGQWSQEEAVQSSTFRELKAVRLVLESIAHKLMNARVRWFTDNQNVVRIIEVGSRKPHIQAEALRVFHLAVQYQIHLEPSWIPREENECADYISRIVDLDDWQLNPFVFGMLDSRYGPHTVDRFASTYNTQLQRFNSRYWNPGSEAVDAFTVDWGGENNWLCPPIGLIPRVLRHAQRCKAEGTMIVPYWESAPFWPILCPWGSTFESFVVAWCDLPSVENLFIPGHSGAVLFGGDAPNTRVLALRLCFH